TTVAIGVFSFFLQTLLTGGLTEIYIFAAVSMALMGMTYGPIGTALAAPFPVAVRYTGASITFNFAGIFGASLAPFIAT
ncbi:MFS transporter, partial [Rhizobium sp. rho-13.1]